MLWVPFLLDRHSAGVLRFDLRGLLRGSGISLAVLFLYLVCFYLLSAYLGKTVKFTEPTALFVFTHLIAIAFPEEFFFRGYLQRTLGGGWGAIVVASVLFAVAHLLVICAFSGGGFCAQNALTFFPSLVMGYLYMRTGDHMVKRFLSLCREHRLPVFQDHLARSSVIRSCQHSCWRRSFCKIWRENALGSLK